jgi:hypothetical protein
MANFFSVMYNTDPREYNATKGLSEMLDIQRKFKVKHPGMAIYITLFLLW